VGLFEEMQNYYEAACPPVYTIKSKLALLPAGVEIIVAETEKIVGFVTLSSVYPGPELTSGLFMKDLFVSAGVRGNGVGKALIQAAAQRAIELGHERVDWTANRENPELLSFYSKLGALEQSEKVFYRLSGDALASMAGQE
jgi:predicted N-acetyltransferase YhbS